MNIPEIYLVEPYNAYAPKGRKKHWHEVIEEQALMARIMAEQQALQEAQSRTLPQNSPETSTPTVGNTAAGAGNQRLYAAFHPELANVSASVSPSGGAAPITITFSNTTRNFTLYNYVWNFGDGTTSVSANPTHLYNTSSNASNIWTASVTASDALTGQLVGTKGGIYISASIPVVSSNFSFTTSSNRAPFTASFVNSSTNSSQTPTTTYKWIIVNGNTTTSSSAVNFSLRIDSGSFTASLFTTGSYGIAASSSSRQFAVSPTITASFTKVSSSISASSTLTFTPTYNYTGSGTLTYLWTYGSASLTSTASTPPALVYTRPGPYTASVSVTESFYNITSFYTQSWRLG